MTNGQGPYPSRREAPFMVSVVVDLERIHDWKCLLSDLRVQFHEGAVKLEPPIQVSLPTVSESLGTLTCG